MTEPARRDWFWWLALPVIAVIVWLGMTVAFVWHPGQSPYASTSCMNNVSQLAACYGEVVSAKRFDPTLHGSAQMLSWIPTLRPGDEHVFVCPGDPDAAAPKTPDAARAYHPADAAALRAARGLGSYAVRDFEKFPIDPQSTAKQPILCDREGDDGRTNHHKRCIVVGFVGGDAQKMTNKDLGIPDGDPIVVGPDSPSELLRVFERP